MKAICLTSSSGSPELIRVEKPKPRPASHQVLVQVHAAGVTSTELGWYPTLHSKSGEPRSRPVPGHEFSGVVSDIGTEVPDVEIGDEIFGMNDWFEDGASAEFCLTIPASIAPKPAAISYPEAAAVPIGALTAWQGLFDRANLQPGERVLIQGGAGGVGVFAVQLARQHGAHVVSTAAPENFTFVQELGANEVLDYQLNYFDQRAGTFDVVFDVVGGETLERSWSLMKTGGRMVTIASQSEGHTDERIKRAFLLVESNREQLLHIGSLLETGRLRVVVDTVLPFSRASEAYFGNFPERRRQGKVVLQIAE